jgi:regulator of replication initiation timing
MNQTLWMEGRIAGLVEQVAALTEDKKSALLNYIDADEQLAMMTEERDKMFAELAAVQARLDAYSWEAENTALRAQVAALTKERDELVKIFAKGLDSELVASERRLRYEVIDQLTAMTKGRDWLNHKSKCLEMERVSQEDYITAAQAQVAQFREALETISDEENWGEDGCWESSSYPDEIAMEALALPSDTAALDARLKKERERCAKVCEGHPDNLGAGYNFATTIREMK